MPGLYSGDPIESPGVEAQGTYQVPATTGQVVGAALSEAASNSITPSFLRMGGHAQPGDAPEFPAVRSVISPDEANQKYSIKGPTPETSLSFSSPVPDDVARSQYDHINAEAVRQDTLSRAQPGFLTGAPAQMVYGLAGGLADPLNLAIGLLPGLGEANEARIAAAAGGGFLGRTAARVVSGAVAGATQAAALEPAQYAIDQETGRPWSMGQAMRDIAYGTALGGGLHVVGGTVADAFGRETPTEPVPNAIDSLSAEGRQEILRTAVAQAMDDKPVDAQPVLDLAPQAEPAKAYTQPLLVEGAQPAFTGAGQRIDVRPEVVEHSSLIASHTVDGGVNSAYPAELQPRDRSAAASQAQIASIAGGLEPARLGLSADASVGAPIVGPDNVVESGNGRTAALGQVYSNPDLAPQAAAYRAFIESQGHDTTGIKQPVLIGRRVSELTPEQRQDFTLGANERSTLAMSSAERAKADQGRVGKSLDLWRGGDVTSAGNRDFVRAFMGQLSPEERGGMMLPDGSISAEGSRRIQSALLAHAYGDALGPTLDRFLNSDADGMKNVAGALSDVAGVWGQVRQAATRGEIPAGMDLTRDLAQAVQTIDFARKNGQRVRDVALQADLDRPPLTEAAARFLRLFYRDAELSKPAGRVTVAKSLARYADEALKATPGDNLFGEGAPAAGDVLQGAIQRTAAEAPQAEASLLTAMRAPSGSDAPTRAADEAMKAPQPTKAAEALARVQADTAALEQRMFPEVKPKEGEAALAEPVENLPRPPEIEAAQALVDQAEKRAAATDAIAACPGVIGA